MLVFSSACGFIGFFPNVTSPKVLNQMFIEAFCALSPENCYHDFEILNFRLFTIFLFSKISNKLGIGALYIWSYFDLHVNVIVGSLIAPVDLGGRQF